MILINPVPTTQPPTNRGQRTPKKSNCKCGRCLFDGTFGTTIVDCVHTTLKRKKNHVHTAHSKWEQYNGTLINLVPTSRPPTNRGQRTKSNCNRGRCLRGGKNWRHNWRLRSHCAQRNARFECTLERELEQSSLELSRERCSDNLAIVGVLQTGRSLDFLKSFGYWQGSWWQ